MSRQRPILYSFRRCPYAMRARLAIAASGIPVELREVVLRAKPAEMLEASPKGTVPVLVLDDGRVIEESFDIMAWALGRNDPQAWLPATAEDEARTEALIGECDGPFKQALDRYKYPGRYEGADPHAARSEGVVFLNSLDGLLASGPFLTGDGFALADAAILPFVRQFAHVDRDWFYAQDFRHVIAWLESFLESARLAAVMEKYPQWQGGEGIAFPQAA